MIFRKRGQPPPQPSARGLRNLQLGKLIDMKDALYGRQYYDPEKCPEGLIDISGSSNERTRDYLAEYCTRVSGKVDLARALEYGAVAGPNELNVVMSNFFNARFNPASPVRPSEILATNGVSSLIDVAAYNMCDEGEGILVITPTYAMFELDLCARARITIVPVDGDSIPDQFSAEHSVRLADLLEEGRQRALREGIKVKALIISNPCNPVGRFYSRETLVEMIRLCCRHGIHLISDEIYALSGFESPETQKLPGFTSVLSIASDPNTGIFNQNVHVLYGASKDWAMGGLRLGFLVTRNAGIWKTCRRLALFTWVTPFSTQFFIDFMSDTDNVARYVKCNQDRLKERYIVTTSAMKDYGIPYTTANGGLFIWIDLSKWLVYFKASPTLGTQALQLCKHLINNGVYMSMGELSMSSRPGLYRFVYTSPNNESVIAVKRLGTACARLETNCEAFKNASSINSSLSSIGEMKDRILLETERDKKDIFRGIRKLSRKFNCLTD
ncbi:pyridoxal phosphate-dependent transferase [Aspergillus venezuelensis]